MANEALDKLRSLRDGKLAEIQKKETDVTHLRREIEILQSAVTTLDEAITAVAGVKPDTGTQSLPNLKVNGEHHKPQNYAFAGLQTAVQSVIDNHGKTPGLLIPDIMAHLKAAGYPVSRELYSSVYTTCVRLRRKGRITDTDRDGKRAFLKKP